jgi:hypothetical protein
MWSTLLSLIIEANHVGPSPPSFCFLSRWNNRSHSRSGQDSCSHPAAERAWKILAGVARSREPTIDKAHAHHRAARRSGQLFIPLQCWEAEAIRHRIYFFSFLLLLPFPSFRQFPSIMAQMKVRVMEKNYSIWKYLSLRRRQLLPQLNKRRLRIHVFVYHPCSTKRRRWLSQRLRSTILIMFARPANCVNL